MNNGGIAGIASGALGNKLHVDMTNSFASPYGNDTWVNQPDPNYPTKVRFTSMLGDLAPPIWLK